MDHFLFDKVRKRQRTAFLLKAISIIGLLLLLLLPLTLYYRRSKPTTTDDPQLDIKPAQKLVELEFHGNLPGDLDQVISDISSETYTFTTESGTESIESVQAILARNISDDTKFQRVWTKLYLPVARQDSELNELSSAQLEQLLTAQQLEQFGAVWDPEAGDFIKSKYDSGVGQQFTDIAQIHQKLTEDRSIVAILPFDELSPKYKVIRVDGKSPFDKGFNKRVYPLLDTVWVSTTDSELMSLLTDSIRSSLGEDNYVEGSTVEVTISGNSTVGVRNFYSREQQGIDPELPFLGLADLTKSSDLFILNNSSSITEDCTQSLSTKYLCGKSSMIPIMSKYGVDAIGIAGDHIMDYGATNYLSMIQQFEAESIAYFGGGINFRHSHQAKVLTAGETRIALLGYAYNSPVAYYSNENLPGSAIPDYLSGDAKHMKDDLSAAENLADITIVHFYWGDKGGEEANQTQKKYATAAIDAGADIVYGTFPNKPQQFEISSKGAIFYSLGNTFTEQITDNTNREGLLLRVYIHKGKVISFELLPTFISDSFQPQIATTDKKDTILKRIYQKTIIN